MSEHLFRDRMHYSVSRCPVDPTAAPTYRAWFQGAARKLQWVDGSHAADVISPFTTATPAQVVREDGEEFDLDAALRGLVALSATSVVAGDTSQFVV